MAKATLLTAIHLAWADQSISQSRILRFPTRTISAVHGAPELHAYIIDYERYILLEGSRVVLRNEWLTKRSTD